MGRVCRKHEQFVQDGAECPYCEPAASAPPTSLLDFVRAEQDRKLRELLPKVEALTKSNPLLQDAPYKPQTRFPECACGAWKFDLVTCQPPLEKTDKDGVHTPERCGGPKLAAYRMPLYPLPKLRFLGMDIVVDPDLKPGDVQFHWRDGLRLAPRRTESMRETLQRLYSTSPGSLPVRCGIPNCPVCEGELAQTVKCACGQWTMPRRLQQRDGESEHSYGRCTVVRAE